MKKFAICHSREKLNHEIFIFSEDHGSRQEFWIFQIVITMTQFSRFFFVRRGSVVLCTAVKWTLVHTLYLLIFLFLCRWTSCLFIQTISYFYRTQSNRQTIFNPLSDCNIENIYVSVRYYNITEKKLHVHIFRDVNFPYL